MSRKYRKLERFFYERPDGRVHLRKLAEEVGVSPGFVSKEIGRLLEAGIVDEVREGNMRLFFADTSSSEYRRRKRAFNIRKVLTSGLVSFLERELNPDALVLYGSYLRGMDAEGDEIDIASVGGKDKIPDLADYEEDLGRDITITHASLDSSEPEVLEMLANGFVLSGYLEMSPCLQV